MMPIIEESRDQKEGRRPVEALEDFLIQARKDRSERRADIRRLAPAAGYNFLRTSFHSLASFALRGASPFAGSGTINASRRRRRKVSANAFDRPIPVLIVFQPASCSSSIFVPSASSPGGSTNR